MEEFIEKFKELADDSFERLEENEFKELNKKIQKILKRKTENKNNEVFVDLIEPSRYRTSNKNKIMFQASSKLFKFDSKFERRIGSDKKICLIYYENYQSVVIEADDLDNKITERLKNGLHFSEIYLNEKKNYLLLIAKFTDEFGWAVYDEKLNIVRERNFNEEVGKRKNKYDEVPKDEETIEMRETYFTDLIEYMPLVVYEDGLDKNICDLQGTMSFEDYFKPFQLKTYNVYNLYQLVDGYKQTVDSLSDLFQMFQQALLKMTEIPHTDLVEKSKIFIPKKCEAVLKTGNACKNYAINGTTCAKHLS